MFYCEKCAIENNWTFSLSKSKGVCEMCGEPAICYDTPSSHLSHNKEDKKAKRFFEVAAKAKDTCGLLIEDFEELSEIVAISDIGLSPKAVDEFLTKLSAVSISLDGIIKKKKAKNENS